MNPWKAAVIMVCLLVVGAVAIMESRKGRPDSGCLTTIVATACIIVAVAVSCSL